MASKPTSGAEREPLFSQIRDQFVIKDSTAVCSRPLPELGLDLQEGISSIVESPLFFQEHNPLVRHTVLRLRQTLEDRGLIEKVGVTVHPDPKALPGVYPGVVFQDLGLSTNLPFQLGYKAAEDFASALRRRTPSAGLLKGIVLSRICSSFYAGCSTAQKLLPS